MHGNNNHHNMNFIQNSSYNNRLPSVYTIADFSMSVLNPDNDTDYKEVSER